MPSTSTLAPVQQPAARPAETTTGPRPLDPSEFQFVSGGAPRNGWLAPVTTTAVVTPAAPRNGW